MSKPRNIKHFIAIIIGFIIIFAVAFVLISDKSSIDAPSTQDLLSKRNRQPINKEQTDNDITMKIEYVLVDQKRIEIFYSLKSDKYLNLSVESKIFNLDNSELEGYSIFYGDVTNNNKEPNKITFDFVEGNTPESLNLECKVFNRGTDEPTQVSDPIPTEKKEESTAQFNFSLNFDKALLNQSELLTLNKPFAIDGQNFEVTTIELYPSQMRVNIKADEKNSNILQSITAKITNEDGKTFDKGSQNITSRGNINSPQLQTLILDSPYYYNHKTFDMYISDVVWLNKDMERVKLDLKNVTADKLPEGVKFSQAVKEDNGWFLTFTAPTTSNGGFYQLFNTNYYDEFGNEHTYGSTTSTSSYYFDKKTQKEVETKDMFNEQFRLENYPHDTVYLLPSYSTRLKLEPPTEINLK